jgi:hypothetical protein
MVFHMRATLLTPDPVHRDLKRYAAKRGATISEAATEMLRNGLARLPKQIRLLTLPSFSVGRPRVDVANREALLDLLDRERDQQLDGKRKRR